MTQEPQNFFEEPNTVNREPFSQEDTDDTTNVFGYC